MNSVGCLPENQGGPGTGWCLCGWKVRWPSAQFRIARKYSLPAGQHQIKFVDPRYEEFTTTVNTTAGKTTDVSQVLKALPPAKGPFGTIHTDYADKFAAVYVNDRFYGHAGEFNNSMQALLLPAGDYTVRIEPVSGGSPVAQTIKLEAGKTVVVK